MSSQSNIFLAGEGNAWYERNKDTPRVEHIMPLLERHGIVPKSVLELGCGNGWRLERLKQQYGCSCMGIDPSRKAVQQGRVNELIVGTTRAMQECETKAYDLIIFGFCLYLVDRDDLFFAVAEADRVLKPGGYIAIQDFYEKNSSVVIVPYKHREGVFCYKMHYEWLWLASTAYRFIAENKYTPGEAVTLIKKVGWPTSATPPR